MAICDELKNLYILNTPEKVERFICTHEGLTEILSEAYKWIMRIFPNVVNLYLELHQDPEEDSKELFVIVETNLSPKETLDYLNKLDEEWLLGVPFQFRTIFNVIARSVNLE